MIDVSVFEEGGVSSTVETVFSTGRLDEESGPPHARMLNI
jgi:hypothetical protein